jgi:hypothetical protein
MPASPATLPVVGHPSTLEHPHEPSRFHVLQVLKVTGRRRAQRAALEMALELRLGVALELRRQTRHAGRCSAV